VVQWGPTRKAKDIRGPSASTWDEVKAFVEGLTVSPVPRVYVAGCREVSRDYVLLGGMSLTQLHMLNYAGAVVNGIIRDHEEVSALGMPVWSAGLGVMDSQGCMKVETRGGECTVNSHPVFQDDLIVGDGNGVVAIGQEVADVVLDRAQEIARIENQVLEQLKAGRDLLALVTDGGHI
jgi:regulator of RNase E activity RraA